MASSELQPISMLLSALYALFEGTARGHPELVVDD